MTPVELIEEAEVLLQYWPLTDTDRETLQDTIEAVLARGIVQADEEALVRDLADRTYEVPDRA